MKHLTLKAATTITDKGLFEAVISAESADREKDVVMAAAMVQALHKWNRPLPLAWEHSMEAKDIFGSIDTQSARAVNAEVVVNGKVDLESDVGKEAWRSFKAGTIGFSYGYLELASTKRKGGGRIITELDVFEVTATATPMHNDTRVVSVKSAKDEEVPEDVVKSAWKLVLSQARKQSPQEDETDDLPDAAFLHVHLDGTRAFPYKDDSGTIDLRRLKKALTLIPQSNLSQDVKDRLAEKAKRIFDNATKALQQVEDGSDEEPEKAKSAPQDPLAREAWELIVPRHTPRSREPEPEPEPPLDVVALQREAWALALKPSGK